MIQTLTGKNAYALGLHKRTVLDTFRATYGDLSIGVFSSDVEDIRAVHSALTTLPFLVEKTLVVLDRPSEHKQLIDKLQQWLEQKNDSTDVLIVEPELDKRTVWAKFLKSQTDYTEFPVPSESQLMRWLGDEIATRHLNMQSSAQRLLVRYVGLDQARLVNELDKLRDYATSIDEEVVMLLIEPNLEETIFSLLDSLCRGNTAAAYASLDTLTKKGTNPHEVITMIGWQLTNLAMIAALRGETRASIAKQSGLHPYTIEKNESLAYRLGLARLKPLLSVVTEAELAVKQEGKKAERVVEVLIATIAGAVK